VEQGSERRLTDTDSPFALYISKVPGLNLSLCVPSVILAQDAMFSGRFRSEDGNGMFIQYGMSRAISSLFIHQRLYGPLLGPRRFFFLSFVILYTVGRTPWTGISPSQGLNQHTGQHKHRIKAHRRPCLEWDSKS
jgi:hypothetical protein